MELKNIVFSKGMYRSPSLPSDEGELSECVNLIPEGGELVNLKPATALADFPDLGSMSLLTTHLVDDDKHYIFYAEQRVQNAPGASFTQENAIHIWLSAIDNAYQMTIYAEHAPDSAIRLEIVYRIGSAETGITDTINVTLQPQDGSVVNLGSMPYVTTVGAMPAIERVSLIVGDGKYAYESYIVEHTGTHTQIATGSIINNNEPSTDTGSDTAPSASYFLAWISDKSRQQVNYIKGISQKPQQVVCLGKSIVMLTDEGMTYLIWKDTYYKMYNGLPEFQMDFDLDIAFHNMKFEKAVTLGKFSAPEESLQDIVAYTSYRLSGDTHFFDKVSGVLNPNKTYICSCKHHVYIYAVFRNGNIVPYELTKSNNYTKEVVWSSDIVDIYVRTSAGSSSSTDVLYVSQSTPAEYQAFQNTYENLTALNGIAKSFIDLYVRKSHQFIFPFFLRYGLKMFNGEVVHVSSPILMVPNWGNAPLVTTNDNEYTTKTDGKAVDALVSAYVANITYRIKSDLGFLREWEDIITGVTVAVSSPIYRYNQGVEFNKYSNPVKVLPSSGDATYSDLYAINLGGKHSYNMDSQSVTARIFLPEFNDGDFKNNIVNKSTFYIIKELRLDELHGSDTLDLSGIAIDAVETLPTLRDDYNSHNTFRPSAMFVYNNRLTIANIREQINEGVGVLSPLVSADESLKFKVVVDISFQGSMKRVVSQEYSGYSLNLLSWFYFPNVGVKSATVFMFDGTDYFKASLTPEMHPYLNGSYLYMPNGLSFSASTQTEYHSQVPDNVVSIPNAVYQSSLNNPFSFPVLTQSQIGTGAIRAITTSAKALSSGTQFGQFPLYAFTSDGIWAVSLDEQGRYVSSSPVNRDIVTNTRSICQTDDAVIYACSEGLKILAGSDSQVLSNALAGNNVDESKFLLGLDECHQSLVKTDTNSFVNMLQNCSVLYDNAGHRHLHIYPDNCLSTGKHFILDLGSGEFSTFVGDSSKVSAIVPDYPFSLIQMADGSIGQFTNEEQNDILRHGIILTRPLSFENPFALKVLADMRMIYSSVNEDLPAHCRVGVYVSNDSIHWKPLRSLHAHSYKWYRFRIQTSLTDMDALKMLTCLVEERQTNKIR